MTLTHWRSSGKCRIAACWIGLGLLLGACATAPSPPHSDKNGATKWRLVPTNDSTSVVVERQTRQGTVSIMCTADGCRTLILGHGQCEEHSIFPVLINTQIESGITQGECLPAQDLADGEIVYKVVLLSEPNLLLPQISLGDNATIAVPMSDGKVEVFGVEMNGVRELIAPLRPELFKAPDWLNEHGLDPRPDDDMDEEEAIRWRRGMWAI